MASMKKSLVFCLLVFVLLGLSFQASWTIIPFASRPAEFLISPHCRAGGQLGSFPGEAIGVRVCSDWR